MKKNIFCALLSVTALVGLAGCGTTADKYDTVLSDSEVEGYYIAGPSQILVNGTNVADWDVGDNGKMTATSINEVAKLDKTVAETLKEREVKALYLLSGIEFGASEASWTAKAYDKNGNIVEANASLVTKFVSGVVDSETGKVTKGSWYTSAEVHGESLTPSTYWVPGHSDVKDANDLDHNANPVVIGGAGTYTAVLAVYSTEYEGSFAGIGMIQTAANADGEQPYKIISGDKYDTKLEDTEGAGYYVAGPTTTTVNGTAIADWAVGDAGKMTAISISDLAKIDKNAAKTLKSRDVKHLYCVENVELGAGDAGWTTLAYDTDGKLIIGNGSFANKFVGSTLDEETGKVTLSGWYTSAEVHGESLTPSTYWVPGHSDVADDNGLDHNSNPAVIGGAGTYTAFVAVYNSAYKGSYCGLGMVQTKANTSESAQKWTEVVPTDIKTMSVIGVDDDWNTDHRLTNNNGTWSGDITVTKDCGIKVRVNNALTFSWGYADLTDETNKAALTDSSGNIGVTAGTYTVTLTIGSQVSPAKKTPSVFTVVKK